MSVILNEVKNLVESVGWKTEILRLMPQNDIATQSLVGGDGEEGEVKLFTPTLTLPHQRGRGQTGH
jgi:hypothetical protein